MAGVPSLIYPARLVQVLRTPVLRLHVTARTMGTTVEDFNRAKDQLGTLKKDPGNEAKLKIYALFKQATQGPCNTPKPSMLDFVNKAKWDAWKSVGNVSQEAARQKYVELISSLVDAEGSIQAAPTSAGSATVFETLLFNTEDNITTIRLNRPEKKNAITVTDGFQGNIVVQDYAAVVPLRKMYNEIVKALEIASKDDSVITVITGSGDYYCSGNDLNNFTSVPEGEIGKMAKDSAELLKGFVKAFIDFPKPLIAVVNGPAVGISVTLLGLFDVVYATERATFHTPFSQLGQSPEGCSSYTFPKMMGAAKASEMLLFNKKLTATEACERGLVTEVFPDATFQTEVWSRLKAYGKLPRNSLALSKQLTRDMEKEHLHAVNAEEVKHLEERWQSDECMNAIVNFFQAKAKL